MFYLKEIIKYGVTRDLLLESTESKKVYTVFDDSDLMPDNVFDFLKVGNVYDCKIGILADVDENGTPFKVISREKIGKMKVMKIQNEVGDLFYIWDLKSVKTSTTVFIKVIRYDLLAVGNIIHDRTIEE